MENVAVDANGKLVFDTKTSAAATSDTITVKVEMQNYTDVTLTVSVILNDKAPQEITGVTAQTGLIYNGEAQKGYTGTPASDFTLVHTKSPIPDGTTATTALLLLWVPVTTL